MITLVRIINPQEDYEREIGHVVETSVTDFAPLTVYFPLSEVTRRYQERQVDYAGIKCETGDPFWVTTLEERTLPAADGPSYWDMLTEVEEAPVVTAIPEIPAADANTLVLQRDQLPPDLLAQINHLLADGEDPPGMVVTPETDGVLRPATIFPEFFPEPLLAQRPEPVTLNWEDIIARTAGEQAVEEARVALELLAAQNRFEEVRVDLETLQRAEDLALAADTAPEPVEEPDDHIIEEAQAEVDGHNDPPGRGLQAEEIIVLANPPLEEVPVNLEIAGRTAEFITLDEIDTVPPEVLTGLEIVDTFEPPALADLDPDDCCVIRKERSPHDGWTVQIEEINYAPARPNRGYLYLVKLIYPAGMQIPEYANEQRRIPNTPLRSYYGEHLEAVHRALVPAYDEDDRGYLQFRT